MHTASVDYPDGSYFRPDPMTGEQLSRFIAFALEEFVAKRGARLTVDGQPHLP